jgi:single-stranded-DNA-specific exonuclease
VINAAGRIEDPHIALNLLLEECPVKSQKIASRLIDLNQKRKALQKQLLSDVLFMIDEKKLFNNSGICVFNDDWHEGVMGIIAGKIKDRFQKPSFVISFRKDGIGKGSARSVPGVHLGTFFGKAKSENIIIDGGGHMLAGGFTISKDKIQKFSEFINSNIEGEFINAIDIDYSISPMSSLSRISQELQVLEPFGKGIEKPLFCIKRVRIKNVRKTTSGTHLMLSLSGEFGDGNIRAILFNANSKLDIVKSIEKDKDNLIDVAGFIKTHEQFGTSIIIEDIRLSEL